MAKAILRAVDKFIFGGIVFDGLESETFAVFEAIVERDFLETSFTTFVPAVVVDVFVEVTFN